MACALAGSSADIDDWGAIGLDREALAAAPPAVGETGPGRRRFSPLAAGTRPPPAPFARGRIALRLRRATTSPPAWPGPGSRRSATRVIVCRDAGERARGGLRAVAARAGRDERLRRPLRADRRRSDAVGLGAARSRRAAAAVASARAAGRIRRPRGARCRPWSRPVGRPTCPVLASGAYGVEAVRWLGIGSLPPAASSSRAGGARGRDDSCAWRNRRAAPYLEPKWLFHRGLKE